MSFCTQLIDLTACIITTIVRGKVNDNNWYLPNKEIHVIFSLEVTKTWVACTVISKFDENANDSTHGERNISRFFISSYFPRVVFHCGSWVLGCSLIHMDPGSQSHAYGSWVTISCRWILGHSLEPSSLFFNLMFDNLSYLGGRYHRKKFSTRHPAGKLSEIHTESWWISLVS